MARAPTEQPSGLVYHPDFVSPNEEAALLEELEGVEYREIRMNGVVARRTAAHFGLDYGYESWKLTPAPAAPPFLDDLTRRVAALVGVEPAALAEVLCTRYPPGAGIGWHRDAPMFGPKVVGVSLGAACRMRFQRGEGAERRVFDLTLAPRAAYVLGGEARSLWQHSIPAVKALRYSITWRTLVNPERWLEPSASRAGAAR